MSENIAVIGAGIAGLTAARRLADGGHAVTVYEKSGGTGGRLSTRRTEFGSFDHGAQYITVKGEAFQALMSDLTRSGAAGLWTPDGKTTDRNWHVGTPGMSSLVKPLLDGFVVKKRTRITAVQRQADTIVCTDESGQSAGFDRVIVAIPTPQAHALLIPVDPAFGVLEKVVFLPCWTGMFGFSEPVALLPDHYRGEHCDSISWLARDCSKPGRTGGEMICAQAGAHWSRDNLDMNKGDVLEVMKGGLEEMAGQPLQPVYAEAHRWLYALVDNPFGKAYLGCSEQRIFAIGDGMLGGRVEAAFESASRLCDHLEHAVM